MWFAGQNTLMIAVLSLAAVGVGVLLRMLVPKRKIFLMFGSAFVYLYAEYAVTELGAASAQNIALGGIAGMVLMGVALPSAFVRWTFPKADEKNRERTEET
ncbi:hypothetical protein [Dysosmobacter sp.]|uniref:hypothetical protein n=1 Tax=Dysosmobacter sp. TaxID=2591382 RepID=UPI002A8F8FA9|nr:hypothetical protein [Dysosmobacter sp.]MDY3281587.1 hypothetical protein [Dysosmobacter sp.]